MSFDQFKHTVRYVAIDNPLSKSCINAAYSAISLIPAFKQQKPPLPPPEMPPSPLPLFKLAGSSSAFLRLAGLSGAIAVGLGAYGAHTLMNKEGNEHNKRVFETANKYHFFHTIALLGVPLCHYPAVTGSLLTAGMVLFCGSCYYISLTDTDGQLRRVTPFGGVCLIIGWLSMML